MKGGRQRSDVLMKAWTAVENPPGSIQFQSVLFRAI